MKWYRVHTHFFILWLFLGAILFALSEVYLSFSTLIDVALAINISTFLLFGIDKFQAIQRGRRIPERVLYLATFLGGAFGTLLGMNLFHHKTRKTSFQFTVVLIILADLVILYFIQ